MRGWEADRCRLASAGQQVRRRQLRLAPGGSRQLGVQVGHCHRVAAGAALPPQRRHHGGKLLAVAGTPALVGRPGMAAVGGGQLGSGAGAGEWPAGQVQRQAGQQQAGRLILSTAAQQVDGGGQLHGLGALGQQARQGAARRVSAGVEAQQVVNKKPGVGRCQRTQQGLTRGTAEKALAARCAEQGVGLQRLEGGRHHVKRPQRLLRLAAGARQGAGGLGRAAGGARAVVHLRL